MRQQKTPERAFPVIEVNDSVCLGHRRWRAPPRSRAFADYASFIEFSDVYAPNNEVEFSLLPVVSDISVIAIRTIRTTNLGP
jgi:hypothetical protein